MPSFHRIDPNIVATAEDMIRDDAAFVDLKRHEVKIAWAFVAGDKDDNGEVKARPIVEKGWTKIARVEINKSKHRVQGCKDAVIFLDQDLYEEMSNEDDGEEKQRSVIWECLYSISVQKEKDLPLFGDDIPARSDEFGRPVLKVRDTDYRVEGYAAAVERFGTHHHQALAITRLADRFARVLSPMPDDDKETEPPCPPSPESPSKPATSKKGKRALAAAGHQ